MAHIDFSHGGNIHEFKGKKIIDFSANINPLGPPEELKNEVLKNFSQIEHYPDPESSALVENIASRWKIKSQNILAGNGSAELIYIVVNAVKPESALIPAPTFSEYERAMRSAGGRISFLRLKEKDNFKLRSVPENKSDIVFICRPNNPTGNFMLHDLHGIEKHAKKLVLLDEAFMDFVPGENKHTFIKKAVESRKTVVLRTFTKMFACPGLRAGYLVGHQDTINTLRKFRPPWNMNSLAQIAAKTAVCNSGFVKKTLRLIEGEREFMFKEISGMDKLTPFPSLVNFILVKLNDESLTSRILQKKLLREGILIRDCSNFRGLNDKYIRIAVRSREENSKLLEALEKALWTG